MNSFGSIFKVQIFGESHGPYVGVVLDGCPPGIPVTPEDFTADLDRRKAGAKGTTPRKEDDVPEIISGIFDDKTTAAPITILFKNSNTRSSDYEKQRAIPRPGHADMVAAQKFRGFNDYRGGGHFSGRLTVALVASGVMAKKLLNGMQVSAVIKELGGEADADKGLQKAINAKDSVGGIIECKITHVPVGLGEPFFDSLESLISHAVFAIPAVRGIEFGTGFAAARMFGSEHNDSIKDKEGSTATNHAGGIVGGLSNGNDIVFRVAIKPTSSTPKEQESYNTETGQVEAFSVKGRHDLSIALRVPVIVEAVTAIVLANCLLELNARNIHYSPAH
jgi:chorismate synthase